MTAKVLPVPNDIQEKVLVGGLPHTAWNWGGAASGETFDVTDPTCGDSLGDAASIRARDAIRAVDVARGAIAGWPRPLPQDGSAILRHQTIRCGARLEIEEITEIKYICRDEA